MIKLILKIKPILEEVTSKILSQLSVDKSYLTLAVPSYACMRECVHVRMSGL